MHSLSTHPTYQNVSTKIPEFKAILWDMDGTILNTESLHFRSILDCVAINDPSDELESFCLGNTDQEVFSHLSERGLHRDFNLADFLAAKEISFQGLIREAQIDQLVAPQMKEFILDMQTRGIPQVVVTSSERMTTEFLLKHVGIYDCFEHIICREDTTENKPSPMPYQLALSKLGLSPSEVIIFEDSHMGLKAAQACTKNTFQAKWY